MIKYIVFVTQVIVNAGGVVLMKQGFLVKPLFTVYGFPISAPLVAGIILYGISFCLNFFVLKMFNLSYIIPIGLGSLYVIILFASYFYFKESISLGQGVGIVLILIGLVLVNIKL